MSSSAHDVTVGELLVCNDVEDFVSSPVGRCVLRASYVMWCATPSVQGAVIWGRLDESSLRDLIAAGLHQRHPALAKSRRLLVDCRHITHVDPEALLGFSAPARERVPTWATAVERQAVVMPSGLAGILIGGALPSVGASHPLRFVHDVESALAYVDDPAARAAHESATRLSDAHRGGSVLLARLRAYLATGHRAASVDTAARSLRMSTRSLQRALARLDTSFSEELRRARVAAAESLLIHSDLKIDAIALEVGFGNASRMSATLRRERNVTPSRLRARFRG